MKITIEHFEEKFTYEGSDGLSTSELIERLYGLCIAIGHHPDNVGGAMYDKGGEGCQVGEIGYEDDIHEYVEDMQSPIED